MKKRLIVGASGASGMPVLLQCLRLLRADGGLEVFLIMTAAARMTLAQETDVSAAEIAALADCVLQPEEIGAGPASGSFLAEGMLVAPCSMKTAAGIRSGYTDNLLLRAADVTVKEQRPLVLAVRETPLSQIHLRNLLELSALPGVRIMPLMLTFYQRPESLDEMIYQTAARLLEPFGVKAPDYRRWTGLRGTGESGNGMDC
ncbi:MAG: UbiX family flavin prenyltransferase [Oscillospiraceae bacterium]|nr:UbiX family flavin prenyltransferase [Oscillospiraceae bacterium]